MCGIVGMLRKKNDIDKETFKTMVSKLHHRGPDDEGIEFFCENGQERIQIALGHRRLSIIDLSKNAHQPMKNKDASLWIVYNGEIYNFVQLRKELIALGHSFFSCSDTEVILHAYQQWGIECLHRLDGMFAFAIWDKERQSIFLATDRFGMKPLYYHHSTEGLFVFASELRVILDSGFVEKRVEPLAVDSFLAYGAVQAPLTMLPKVFSLLPAHYLLYNYKRNDVDISPYWRPSDSVPSKPLPDKEVFVNLRTILRDVVRRHLVSDVPVGLFLSGGIDSSSVVILASELTKGALESFSVTFQESVFSEEKYSQLIAKLYCKNHRDIKITEQDLLNSLPFALKSMDQPTIDGINVYMISRLVRNAGVKVVLSGQGGDEVFGGYSTFKRIPQIQMFRRLLFFLPSFMREYIGKLIVGQNHYNTMMAKIAQILQLDMDSISLYLVLRQLFSSRARISLMNETYNNGVTNRVPLYVMESLLDEIKHYNTFNSISLLDMRLYMANMLLRDGDCMSMAHGLEVRMPFLDRELVEFVFNISSKLKSSNRLLKPLLVGAMRDSLPEAIYNRPKMGFTFPWPIWLKAKLRDSMEEVLCDSSLGIEAGLNTKECVNVWRKFLSGGSGVNWARPWALYVLLQWCRTNLVP